jgi:hypothetical protein
MTYSRFGRSALIACTIAALLAGCAGSQNVSPGAQPSFVRSTSGSYGYCPALSGGTGILPDGDFSQALNPGDHGPVYGKGYKFAPQWKVSKGNINFDGTGVWGGALRDYCSVELDGYIPGGITTSRFATDRGASYTLSFDLSANCGGKPDIKKMQVSIDEQIVQYTWDTSGNNCASNGDYTAEKWQFKATGKRATLTFTSKDARCCGYGPIVEQMVITKN